MTDKPKKRSPRRLVIFVVIALVFAGLVFYSDKIHDEFYPNFMKSKILAQNNDSEIETQDKRDGINDSASENEIKTKIIDIGDDNNIAKTNNEKKKLSINKDKQAKYLNTLKVLNAMLLKLSINQNYLSELSELKASALPFEVENVFSEMEKYSHSYLGNSESIKIFPKEGVVDKMLGNIFTVEKKTYVNNKQRHSHEELMKKVNVLTDYYFSIKYQNHVVFND